MSIYFPVERGVGRGEQLSPYLFILAIETLAISTQADEAIHRLKIRD